MEHAGKKVLKDMGQIRFGVCHVCSTKTTYQWHELQIYVESKQGKANRTKDSEEACQLYHQLLVGVTRFIHDLIIYALHYWTLLYQQEYAHLQVFQSKHVAL